MRSVLITLAVITAACASQTPVTQAPVPLEERERLLSRAIVRHDRGLRQNLVANEFDCAYITIDGKTIYPHRNGSMRSASACTGLGGGPSRATEWQFAADREFPGPRVVEIETIKVEHEGDDTATVIMEQSYRNWFPGDAGMVRRARVTDKWVLRDGQWRIVHRLSQAL